jgi:hypothetical protein
MFNGLTLEELEAIESIRDSEGWKLVLKLLNDERIRLQHDTFRAQERHIQNGNVTIIESVVGQVQRNAGKADGLDYVSSLIELSKKKRQYVQEKN